MSIEPNFQYIIDGNSSSVSGSNNTNHNPIVFPDSVTQTSYSSTSFIDNNNDFNNNYNNNSLVPNFIFKEDNHKEKQIEDILNNCHNHKNQANFNASENQTQNTMLNTSAVKINDTLIVDKNYSNLYLRSPPSSPINEYYDNNLNHSLGYFNSNNNYSNNNNNSSSLISINQPTFINDNSNSLLSSPTLTTTPFINAFNHSNANNYNNIPILESLRSNSNDFINSSFSNHQNINETNNNVYELSFDNIININNNDTNDDDHIGLPPSPNNTRFCNDILIYQSFSNVEENCDNNNHNGFLQPNALVPSNHNKNTNSYFNLMNFNLDLKRKKLNINDKLNYNLINMKNEMSINESNIEEEEEEYEYDKSNFNKNNNRCADDGSTDTIDSSLVRPITHDTLMKIRSTRKGRRTKTIPGQQRHSCGCPATCPFKNCKLESQRMLLLECHRMAQELLHEANNNSNNFNFSFINNNNNNTNNNMNDNNNIIDYSNIFELEEIIKELGLALKKGSGKLRVDLSRVSKDLRKKLLIIRDKKNSNQGVDKKPIDKDSSVNGIYKPWCCTWCTQRFTRKYEKIRHERVKHMNIRPYICEDCGKTFARTDALQRHKLIEHKMKLSKKL